MDDRHFTTTADIAAAALANPTRAAAQGGEGTDEAWSCALQPIVGECGLASRANHR